MRDMTHSPDAGGNPAPEQKVIEPLPVRFPKTPDVDLAKLDRFFIEEICRVFGVRIANGNDES